MARERSERARSVTSQGVQGPQHTAPSPRQLAQNSHVSTTVANQVLVKDNASRYVRPWREMVSFGHSRPIRERRDHPRARSGRHLERAFPLPQHTHILTQVLGNAMAVQQGCETACARGGCVCRTACARAAFPGATDRPSARFLSTAAQPFLP